MIRQHNPVINAVNNLLNLQPGNSTLNCCVLTVCMKHTQASGLLRTSDQCAVCMYETQVYLIYKLNKQVM